MQRVLAGEPPPWLARIIGRDRGSPTALAVDPLLTEAEEAP
jgi:hypothetical protein